MKHIDFTVNDKGTAEIVFNNNDLDVNLLSEKVLLGLESLLEEITENRDIKILLFKSAKKDLFIAGADIKELAADGSLITQVNAGCWNAFAAIHDCLVPVVAACHGYVLCQLPHGVRTLSVIHLLLLLQCGSRPHFHDKIFLFCWCIHICLSYFFLVSLVFTTSDPVLEANVISAILMSAENVRYAGVIRKRGKSVGVMAAWRIPEEAV